MYLAEDIWIEILSFKKAKEIGKLRNLDSEFNHLIKRRFSKRPLICFDDAYLIVHNSFYSIFSNDKENILYNLSLQQCRNHLRHKNLRFKTFIVRFSLKKMYSMERKVLEVFNLLAEIKHLWFHGYFIVFKSHKLLFSTELYTRIIKDLCFHAITVEFYQNILDETNYEDWGNIDAIDDDVLFNFLHHGYKDEFFGDKRRCLIFSFFSLKNLTDSPFESLIQKLVDNINEDTKKVSYSLQLLGFRSPEEPSNAYGVYSNKDSSQSIKILLSNDGLIIDRSNNC